MKKNVFLVVKGIFFLLLCSLNSNAQAMKSMGQINGVELVNSKLIHATEVTLKPGEKSNVHTHSAHFYYALTDMNLKVRYKDGKEELYDMKAGESGVSDPERPHSTQNIGLKTARFLIVELKEHPYKAPK
jgi:uncharacterized RmlC-like cupin family protein